MLSQLYVGLPTCDRCCMSSHYLPDFILQAGAALLFKIQLHFICLNYCSGHIRVAINCYQIKSNGYTNVYRSFLVVCSQFFLSRRQSEAVTRGLIGSLTQASSPEALIACVEALNEHLIRYPSCKGLMWQVSVK